MAYFPKELALTIAADMMEVILIRVGIIAIAMKSRNVSPMLQLHELPISIILFLSKSNAILESLENCCENKITYTIKKYFSRNDFNLLQLTVSSI